MIASARRKNTPAIRHARTHPPWGRADRAVSAADRDQAAINVAIAELEAALSAAKDADAKAAISAKLTERKQHASALTKVIRQLADLIDRRLVPSIFLNRRA